MRTLGLLFIIVGVLLCLSFLFFFPGLLSVGVGALLYMAGGKKPSELGETTRGAGRRSAIALAIVIAVLTLGALMHRAAPTQPAPAHTAQAVTHAAAPAAKPLKHASKTR